MWWQKRFDKYLPNFLKRTLRRLPQSRFGQQVFTLSSGTAVAHLITISASALLSRIYSPEEFGSFGTYTSFMAILASVVTLKYEWAIVTCEDESDAIALRRLSIVLTLIATLAIQVGIITYSVFSQGEMPTIYWFLPLSIGIMSLYQIASYWANRHSLYSQISQSRMLQSVTNSSMGIGFGIVIPGEIGLVLATLVSNIFGFLRLQQAKLRTDNPSANSVLSVFRKYNRFPKYSAPAALLNIVSYRFEYILFLAFFTAPQIGAYYLWNRIVGFPRQLIASSIWQVFLQDSSKTETAQIGVRMQHRQRTLIRLTSVPYYSSMFVLPSILGYVFGDQWKPYTDLLIPILIGGHLNLVVASFSLFVVLNKNTAELVFNAILFVAKLSSVLVTYWLTHNFFASVWSIGLTQALLFAFLGDWNYQILGMPRFTFVRMYFIDGIWQALPALIILALASQWITQPLLLIGTFVVVNLVYLIIYAPAWAKKKILQPNISSSPK